MITLLGLLWPGLTHHKDEFVTAGLCNWDGNLCVCMNMYVCVHSLQKFKVWLILRCW